MRNIHGFNALFVLALAVPAALSAKSPAADTPPTPVAPKITGSILAGTYAISGTAQIDDLNYKATEVFICVWKKRPADGTSLNCLSPENIQERATLANADKTATKDTGDYVLIRSDGTFSAILSAPLVDGNYISATESTTATTPADAKAQSTPSEGYLIGQFLKTAPLGAAVAGLDVSGASSTDYKAVFLGTGIMDFPLANGGDIEKADRTVWLNGQLRIAGMAQPTTLTGALGSTASVATYLAQAVNANPESIVQSIEATGTVAFQFTHWKWAAGDFDVGDYTTANLSQPNTLITLSGIASIGAITPLSASQANPPVYNLTQQIYSIYSTATASVLNPPIPTGCTGITYPSTTSTTAAATPPVTQQCYVAFIPTDRSHFYRNWEAGVRLKLYAGDYHENRYRFPGVADLTLGQNEYVTGGQMRHFVVHIGGAMPVPHLDGVYIFGSMDSSLMGSKGGNQQQLILIPATTSSSAAGPIAYTSQYVVDISVPQPNRDRYRIGFGVDIFHLIHAGLTKKTDNTTSGKTSGN